MNWQRKGIRRNSSVESVTALDLNRIGSRVHAFLAVFHIRIQIESGQWIQIRDPGGKK
jgi:hypothetical protein